MRIRTLIAGVACAALLSVGMPAAAQTDTDEFTGGTPSRSSRIRIFRPFSASRYSRLRKSFFGLPTRVPVTQQVGGSIPAETAASTSSPASSSPEPAAIASTASTGRPSFRPRPRSPFRPTGR